MDDLEPFDGPFDHAEAFAQELEGIAAFVREKCPELAGQGDETWRVVIKAKALMPALDSFAAVLDETGAAMFGDKYGDDAVPDDVGPEGTARALSEYLRRMAETVDAHREVAVLDNWIKVAHRLMGVDGGWISD